MKTVRISNLGEIKSVFNDDSINSFHYNNISKQLRDSIEKIEFARPIVQVNQGTITWQSDSNNKIHSYSSLDKESRNKIDIAIKNSISFIKSIFNNNADFFDKIIEIPSEDAIYYTQDNLGNIGIILTEWGYSSDDHAYSTGVLKKIFETTSRKSFILKFKSGINEPLEGIQVKILSGDINLIEKSSKDGFIKINNLRNGNTLQISSVNKQFDTLYLDINNLNEYTIVINKSNDINIKVFDSKDMPISNTKFIFKSDKFPKREFTTDINGRFTINHPEINGSFQIFSKENEELLNEQIPNTDSNYKIFYNIPKEEEPIVFDDDTVEEVSKVELEFLNWRKKPIRNQEVHLYGEKGKEVYTTNDDGIIFPNSIKENITYGIFMNYKSTDWKKEFSHSSSENKYTFIVKKRNILWWWFSLLLFFLLLSLIPTEIEHHYTVLNKRTRQPIPSTSISSTEIVGMYQTQNFNETTDENGKLTISYGKKAIYKQILSDSSTDIFVQKMGYENLTATVLFGFFKTRESIIYLDEVSFQEHVNPTPNPIENCNSGGDASNSGEKSIQEFDLQQDNGTFIFSFYTGDKIPDEIRVYNCPASEINNNVPIFQIDAATERQVPLKFTNRILTVVVDGRGDINSVWEYFVNCP